MINKISIAVSVLIVAVLAFFVYQKYFLVKPVHYHAGFRIFVDGVLQDFSGPEYMSLQPCTDKAHKVNDQNDKAHLHDRIGYVAHVHLAGVQWSDLLTNIHYQPDRNKPMAAYINGKKVENVLDMPINPYDSLVLLIGKHGDIRTYLQQAVTIKEIKTAEKRSENCGS
jgi:hypothetical protein